MNCNEAGEVLVNLIYACNANNLKEREDYKNLMIAFFKEHSIKEGLSLLPVQESPVQEDVAPNKSIVKEHHTKMQKAKKAIEGCLIKYPNIGRGNYQSCITSLTDGTYFTFEEIQELKQHEKDVKALIESTSIIGGTEATEYLKQQIENMLHASQ